MTPLARRPEEPSDAVSRLRRFGLAARDFMLRTDQSRFLRPLWSLAYELLLRGVAFCLQTRNEAGVYVGGSFGFGEPVFGISDVDLIVVARRENGRPGRARLRVKEAWRRMCRFLPFLPLLIAEVYVYEDDELRDAASSTCLTYGLARACRGGAVPRALYFGPARLTDEGGLLLRPGLWATEEWRLLWGSDLRQASPETDRHQHRLAAWLELQFWWRFAFAACAEPRAPHVPYLCVKLVAEPARIWLWLAHGEQLFARRGVLARALERIPDEEESLRAAMVLHDKLARSPEPPLAEVLPCFVRLTERIARLVAAEIGDAGTTEVRLVPSEEPFPLVPAPSLAGLRTLVDGQYEPHPLPLVDWRARTTLQLGTRTAPQLGEEAFALVPGDPADAAVLGKAARLGSVGIYPALQAEGLLALPSARSFRTLLRAIQFPGSDPVSFALAAGHDTASFPNVAGWSARDAALRAAAEHRAWLESLDADGQPGESRGPEAALVMLLSAARAALFLEGLDTGEPELPLTLAATAERLGERSHAAAAIAGAAISSYRALCFGVGRPSQHVVAELAEVVRTLPTYSARGRPSA